ncbi:class I SAM-dependent methyltransferase [Serratia fonticola]|uniref:class I SAM-dependent methyltransferase n=1 Tax=Serratia fonticola TaxID=47917 RepID=UPI00217C3645|nr:class I SAM-dependent methyltransferase [Serratia fonticola]CAI0732160.1 Probable S-adenosylmethionine-dependent methyltransferase MSMEG_2350 [Serratia fonticola]CAI0733685.1 Probable S-adenosylmethionine-dependent methyltransferase MSMEG_2350 [Serratia fonticola]CAI1050856.1 Probable S-adenosylmethionine-dependent methyltransferase MSMEG_2350 [Serratia fonticola]CAI1561390.1 Probable S-adenosylmethionine-dependent methyltransferase MSMEG_2350 [Serratia fonticola]CAI1713485.1 Probable S-ade
MSDDFYRVFEEEHRGSVQDIKQRLSVYLPFITALAKIYPSAEVADVGCGRGEWLETLRDNAIPAMGVDLDDGMLERALQIGLNVKKMDCLAFLQQQADASLLAITGFHIAEHLPFEVLQSLVKEALRVLKPGGLLILETPNPENVSVGTCSFYMDPTHNHPLPPALLEFIPNYYGFLRTKILRLQEKAGLRDSNSSVYLVDVLKGVSPDYSLIAQKEAEKSVVRELDPYFEKEYGVTLDGLSDRYDQRLNSQFKRMDKVQRAQEAKLHDVGNQLERFQRQWEKSHQELMAVHAHNQSLQQQLIDVHASNSWRVTYPLRWVSGQLQAVRDEGIKARGRKAVKKVLRKTINTALNLFHEHPKFKGFVLSSARKLGVYRLLQSVFRRVLNSAPNYHADLMANERHVVYQDNMTSRAIDMYEQLKNANNKKHGES